MPIYLAAIEGVLAAHPELVHYRVLFGPPRHAVLTDHLLRLLDLRDPADRSLGKTLHIGMVVENPSTPERFFCASEISAVATPASCSARRRLSASSTTLGTATRPRAEERLCRRSGPCLYARPLPVIRVKEGSHDHATP
ncbi:MAG: hypothetical protein ACRDTD_19365 [Pseudonocardiaceae bacterium]